MGGIPVVGVVIGRFIFPPIYGVAVAVSCGGNGNGFIISSCLPRGNEGFRVVLCLPKESDQNSED
ncbi:MAG: hypothetical protein GDA51_12485 [Ekhidna sp.]|nr:hypothetical protein [Ekhidna sp.]